MALKSGRLRHRIEFQQKVKTQDPNTGEILYTWATVDGLESVPAAIEPLSVKEFMAAQANQSQIVARMTIRARDGLSPTMRIVHRGMAYNPAGFLRDPDSGLEYMTIPVTEGVNDGS